MRKILLSMALLAASGAYVGYENYVASASPAAGSAALPLGASAKAAEATSTGSTPSALAIGAAATPCSTGASASATDAAIPPPAAPVAGLPAEKLAPTISLALPAPAAVTAASPVPVPRLRPTEVPAAEPTNAAAQAAVRYHDGTFKGTDANAYYGHVQVEAVIKGGQITAINVLDYPSDRRTSRYINGQALPALEQEAIQAQSANIDGVSGATLTSEAFAQSLDAALSAAGGGGSNA